MQKVELLVPPDGGWGWMVVLGCAIVQTIVMPISHSFGLIFAKRFSTLGLSATDVSVLMNANAAFGMSLGLLNGPLLRFAGCRKVALIGGVLISAGIMLSATAHSFTELLLTYGLIMSIGGMMLMSAFSTAVNTYFKEKRSRATSITMTLAALGPIFLPYFITGLMSRYGVFGCVLILGAISTHTIMAALLLQPVEWHMKKKTVTATEEPRNRKTSSGMEGETNNGEVSKKNHKQYDGTPAKPTSGRFKNISSAIVRFLDLDILKDGYVRNIILGMILSIFIEINFSQMIPFLLSDSSFTSTDIASFMTLMSAIDIIGRFASPFVDEYFEIGAKNMFIGGMASMVVIRTGLLYAETYYEILFVGILLGLIKGVSSVYMHLILPTCLPIEKLPAAGGVLMLGCGIFLMMFGPCMGKLRDLTGSYTQGIMVLNTLSLVVITFWTLQNRTQKRAKA